MGLQAHPPVIGEQVKLALEGADYRTWGSVPGQHQRTGAP